MSEQPNIVLLDGCSLTFNKLDKIISNNDKINLTNQAWEKVFKSRKAIDDMMADPKKVVYGVTTGFGSFANVSISHEDRQQLQINLIRSHAVGVGQPVPVDIVRRMLILRINTLSKGRSGVRPDTLQKMIKAYNNNFYPRVPCQGTVGASGDLAPLSHLALGLLGEGLAYDFQSKTYKPAEEIMGKLGLQKIHLMQKEGLALINGTQFMAAIISAAATTIDKLFYSSLSLYAIFSEVFGISRQLFTQQTEAFYGQFNGQLGQIIKVMRELIGNEESELHKARALSDDEVSSSMDFVEGLSGIIKTFRMARRMIEEEMNGATDNPLVFFKEDGFQKDELISAGNFHGEYVAKAADFLGFALFDLGKFSEARSQRYINGKISRLPHFLVKKGGLNSGHMITQYTSAALLSESKVLVKPASADSIVTSAGQEDYVSMGGFAARKCQLLVENVSRILGIELLLSLTAVNIIGLKSSEKLNKTLEKVQEKIKPLIEDRYFGPEIQEAAGLVLSNLQMI